MTKGSIRRAALVLTGTAALGMGAITGVAATSHATAGVTRTVASGKGETFTFSVTTLRAPAGKVTLKLTNRSDLSHDIALRGKTLAAPRKGKIVGKGKVSTVVVTLPAGTYTYYCSVSGHEKAGMRGTLTVGRR